MTQLLPFNQSYRWIDSRGLPPPIFEPEDVETCRRWIIEKNREAAAVLIAGGTSHWFLGNNPARVTDILSLRKWKKVIEYNPGDLTITVEAGCPFLELTEVLRNHGQFLPFFPVNSQSSTVGGIVASGLSGPYGPALGGPRDFLIGIEVLHPEGILSHAGGKVVKNVAGYDLCKLYTGSMGSLGVITRLTFKLRPRPQETRTMTLGFDGFPDLFEAAVQIRDRVDPAALEIIQPGDSFLAERGGPARFLLAVQLLDSTSLTAWKVSTITESFPQAQLLTDREEQELWSAWHGDFCQALQPANQRAVLRVNSPLGRLTEVYRTLAQEIPFEALSGHMRNGTLFLFTAGTEFLPPWQKFAREWISKDVYSMLFKADAEVKTGIDVWGPTTQPLNLMKKIKQRLDPSGILNPGRFL